MKLGKEKILEGAGDQPSWSWGGDRWSAAQGKAVGAACGPMDVAGGMGMHHQEEHASFSE